MDSVLNVSPKVWYPITVLLGIKAQNNIAELSSILRPAELK
jgi:hypothetical protein